MMDSVTGVQLTPEYVFGPVISAVLDALKSSVCSLPGSPCPKTLSQIENRSVWPSKARISSPPAGLGCWDS